HPVAHDHTFFLSFTRPAPPVPHPLSLHDALPICARPPGHGVVVLDEEGVACDRLRLPGAVQVRHVREPRAEALLRDQVEHPVQEDRKSTRLNSSHEWISYAVFCLKKKNRRADNSY